MSSEQLMILNMVSEGKLTVDEATLLLESIARLEVNDPAPNKEITTDIEPEPQPEPVSRTSPVTAAPTDRIPDSQLSDSIEEQTKSHRTIWESIKHYIQRFRQPHPS